MSVEDENTQRDSITKISKNGKKLNLTKIIVRRLPPRMTTEEFIEVVSPLPEYDFLVFVEGDLALEPHSFSRAYINFLNIDDIYIFRDKFDGYVFLDGKGNEYVAIVEFAPFQKIPKSESKDDSKNGTLESDSDYLEFLTSHQKTLENSTHNTPEQYLEEIESKDKKKIYPVTPLVEAFNERNAEKMRIRDEKRELRKKRDEEKKRIRDEERRKRKESHKNRDKGGDESQKSSVFEVVEGKSEVSNPSRKIQNFKMESKGKGLEVKKGGIEVKKENKNSSFCKRGSGGGGERRPPEIFRKREDEPRHRKLERLDKKIKREKASVAPPPAAAAGTNKGPDVISTSTLEKNNCSDESAKSKRYSDRRRQERCKREKKKEGDFDDEYKLMREEGQYEEKEREVIEESFGHFTTSSTTSGCDSQKIRLKNKERPSMVIYRPGMGKFSSQSLKKMTESIGKSEESFEEPSKGRCFEGEMGRDYQSSSDI